MDGGDEIFRIHTNQPEAYPAPAKLVSGLFSLGQVARAWHWPPTPF